jgi:hypothetical protein
MDGATALEFVRERHAFAQQDLARVKDQQAFADAVKQTLISPATWPRYPAMLSAFQQNMMSTLPWNALPVIGVQYMMPGHQVTHQYINIENGMVNTSWSNDGQSILVPTGDGMANLIHQDFTDPNIAAENASVEILNGTSTSGVAADAQQTLQGLGYRIVMAGNADSSGYRQTQVILNTSVAGKADYTARRLQRQLNAGLVKEQLPGQQAQIVVILGSDFPGA